MRILFVSLIEALWGGSEVLWSQAALAARRQGWKVGASFPYYKNIPQSQQLQSAGVRLFFGSPTPRRWWQRLGEKKRDRQARFAQILDEFAPELILINQGGVCDGLAEMAECRRRGLRYMILNQAVEPLFYDEVIRRNLEDAYSTAERIWFVSSENLNHIREYLKIPLFRVGVVTNAYHCSFNVECPWPEETAPLKLAIVARLYPIQKGQDLVLEALALPKWRERDMTVTLFGEGPSLTSLEAKQSALKLQSVQILGESADVADIWRNHHALLLPSRFEGQSLAMIEAMLHSRLVIATPVGGTGGVIIDGKTGFLAKSADSLAALDEVLEHAWAARSRWQEIGSQARSHIRTLVSPNPGGDFLKRIEQR